MSDQREAGTDPSLEEIFLSREFGRAPTTASRSTAGRRTSSTHRVEQVLLPGRSEAQVMTTPGPVPAHPHLVVPGGAVGRRSIRRGTTLGTRRSSRERHCGGRIVVAGVASSGRPSRRPTVWHRARASGRVPAQR